MDEQEKLKLQTLRKAIAKGVEQAERGEFSEHTVDSLLDELNGQALKRQSGAAKA